MILSVLIISHNQKELLRRCIESVLQQNLPFEHELIISDDASTDGTWELAQEYAEKLKEKYNILYIQIEELNLPLLQKYILHIVIVISAHIFIFFYCPMTGNLNIFNTVYCQYNVEEDDNEKQCNDFLNNKALIVFYWLYIIYFVSSGLQVKYGFHDMKRK